MLALETGFVRSPHRESLSICRSSAAPEKDLGKERGELKLDGSRNLRAILELVPEE